ncbi:surface-adhesin E family protein [Caulobacter segnis]
MLTALMLAAAQAAPAATEPSAPSKVDSVTVTAPGKASAPLPKWSTRIEESAGLSGRGPGQGDHHLRQDGQDARRPNWRRVWVRHEFRVPQTEAGADLPIRAHGPDIDCEARTFRSLAVYRYPENNLKGAETAYAFEQRDWTRPEPGAFDESVVEAACMKPLAAG